MNSLTTKLTLFTSCISFLLISWTSQASEPLRGTPLPSPRGWHPREEPSLERTPWKRVDDSKTVMSSGNPTPSRRAGRIVSAPQGYLVRHDLITGEETRIPASEAPFDLTSFSPSSLPASRRPEKGVQPHGEFGFTRVTDPTVDPYRAVCRFKFTHQNPGGTRKFATHCSGTLIDPMHLLTAGHCIYKHPDDPDDDSLVRGWPVRVEVWPAYEDGAKPLGTAFGVSFYSWEGWTEDEDFDHDIAFIELNWPIGASAGHLGLGTSDSCLFFQTRAFTSAGYPGQEFQGRFMYSWTGPFISCDSVEGFWYGEEVRTDAFARRGQSGSGAWTTINGHPTVFAVLSNLRSWLEDTDFPRINEAKFDDIRREIRENRNPTIELFPFDLELSEDTVRPGDTIQEVRYRLFNNSRSSFGGVVDVRFLITEKLEPGEEPEGGIRFFTELARHRVTFNQSLDSGATVDILMDPVQIPEPIHGGNYEASIEVLWDDLDFVRHDSRGYQPVEFTVLPTACEGRSLGLQQTLYLFTESQSLRGSLVSDGPGHRYRVRMNAAGRVVFDLCEAPRILNSATLCLYDEAMRPLQAAAESCNGRPRISVDLDPGTYNLGVSAPPGESGAYRLSYGIDLRCNDQPLEDFGSIDPRGDWKITADTLTGGRTAGYRLEVSDAGLYTFSTCEGGGATDFDAAICLFDRVGNPVEVTESNCDNLLESPHLRARLDPGEYTLSLMTPTPKLAGSYRLASRREGLCNGQIAIFSGRLTVTTREESLFQVANGVESSFFYEVRIDDGSICRFETCGSDPDNAYLDALCLYDRDWNLVDRGETCRQGVFLESFLSAGTYYLGLSGPRGSKGNYSLTYVSTPSCEGDTNVFVGALHPLPGHREVEGQLQVGVADGYVIEAPYGGQYTFSTCGSEAITNLCLYDHEWNLVRTASNECRRQARLEIGMGAGTYYLFVTGRGDTAGSYTLSYRGSPACGRNSMRTDPRTLEPNATLQTIEGSVFERDGVQYEVVITRNGDYRFELCGSDGFADFDSQLCLFQADGNILDSSDDACGEDARIERELSTFSVFPGRYYLSVAPANGSPGGDFRLAYRRVVPDPSGGSYRRCDHNCDGTSDITDVISGLSELFLSGDEKSCCEAISDCNSDTIHDLSDWIYLLGVLFLGEKQPEEPYQKCGGTGCDDYDACTG